MKHCFNCPSCKGNSWMPIEKYSFLKRSRDNGKFIKLLFVVAKIKNFIRILILARPRKGLVQFRHLTPYLALRRDVLFKVWFDNVVQIELTSIHCENCGFVCYAPRPTDQDIVEKYSYLKKFDPDQGGQSGLSSKGRSQDANRSSRIYKKCMEHFHDANIRVLDYGGGNGKLMRPFLEKNIECHIIDYNDNPLPGITKIGDDIGNYFSSHTYDLIICSHVLEHVSDISKLVTGFQTLLSDNGCIYAEVPIEIWGGLRIDEDPVTHINYFSLNSLCNFFAFNGFIILEKQQLVSTYSLQHKEVAWVIAKKNDTDVFPILPVDIMEMLHPSRLNSLKTIMISLKTRFLSMLR